MAAAPTTSRRADASADKLRRTKDHARTMQFAKFPFAEAYARLQLHYSSRGARGNVEALRGEHGRGRTGTRPRREGGKVASGICKFFGRAGLHKSRVIVAFRNSLPFSSLSAAATSS